ncbi:MAG: hypothetical protein Q9215_000731 [Flavoplaca cf. flavocitrina]
MFLLIGSNAMQLLALRNEFTTYSRRADAKIGLLKEVIERVQKGEDVDVKGLLGTGNPENEKEWEQGHVNNTRYIRYAESGRVNWVQNYAKYHDTAHRKEWEALCSSKGHGMILRSIKTDFKFPMSWPDRVSVYHKLQSPPSTSVESFTLDVLIVSERHQRVAARCVEDIVVYDYRRREKTNVQPFMLEQFDQTWRAQEEAKRVNTVKASKLVERVRRLEEESWDKEGAVEDVGQR